MYDNAFGKKIRQLRLAQNLTQTELGKIVGVSMQAISKWEHGSIPDVSILLVLADYFRVTLDSLMGLDSNVDQDANSAAYHTVLQSAPNSKFEVASELCWSSVKGATGIPDIENLPYSPSNSLENSRFRLCTEKGVAYGIVTDELHTISVMPEPDGGFWKIASTPEEYSKLFRFLGDPECMAVFLFVGSRSQSLFTAGLAAKETGISERRIEKILSEFVNWNWLSVESADITSGSLMLYRCAFRENFLFFLLFAREMMLSPRFWYLSSISSRSKPLLNKKND